MNTAGASGRKAMWLLTECPTLHSPQHGRSLRTSQHEVSCEARGLSASALEIQRCEGGTQRFNWSPNQPGSLAQSQASASDSTPDTPLWGRAQASRQRQKGSKCEVLVTLNFEEGSHPVLFCVARPTFFHSHPPSPPSAVNEQGDLVNFV